MKTWQSRGNPHSEWWWRRRQWGHAVFLVFKTSPKIMLLPLICADPDKSPEFTVITNKLIAH